MEKKPRTRFEHFIRSNGLLQGYVADLFEAVGHALGEEYTEEVDMLNRKIVLFASDTFEQELLASANDRRWALDEIVQRKSDSERAVITDIVLDSWQMAGGPLRSAQTLFLQVAYRRNTGMPLRFRSSWTEVSSWLR